jgi:hypothetical protein
MSQIHNMLVRINWFVREIMDSDIIQLKLNEYVNCISFVM